MDENSVNYLRSIAMQIGQAAKELVPKFQPVAPSNSPIHCEAGGKDTCGVAAGLEE